MSLVSCVPNFSEGRRPDVIEEIRAAIAAVPGVVVLDVSSDAAHNRSVITFVAPVAQAVDAAFAGIRVARDRIDLTVHRGEHPRMGATDVVPFVPLEGTTMEECIALARELGARDHQTERDRRDDDQALAARPRLDLESAGRVRPGHRRTTHRSRVAHSSAGRAAAGT